MRVCACVWQGLEACLWSEFVRTPERADYMLYPRVLALAERAWHAADWESIVDDEEFDKARQRDWAQFAAALGHRELRRLDQLGVNYRLPRPGVMYAPHIVLINHEHMG